MVPIECARIADRLQSTRLKKLIVQSLAMSAALFRQLTCLGCISLGDGHLAHDEKSIGFEILVAHALRCGAGDLEVVHRPVPLLSLIHISEPTRLGMISYAVFCLKKKKIREN